MAIFNRAVKFLLSSMTDFKNYADDVIHCSHGFYRHIRGIAVFLYRLKKNNLRIHPKKASIFNFHCTVFGFDIYKDGIRIARKTMDDIHNFPMPKNIKEVKKFLGKVNFIQHMIPSLGKYTAILSDLTKSKKDLEWSPLAEESFDLIKAKCHKDIFIAFPDFDKDFYLFTDASGYALGGVLCQKKSESEGDFQIIMCIHKKFSDSQRVHSPTKRELYAIVVSLRKVNKVFYGLHFKVLTDHKPIVDLIKGQNDMTPDILIIRWIQEISSFILAKDVFYVPGHKNFADFFSRIKSVIRIQIAVSDKTMQDWLDEMVAEWDQLLSNPGRKHRVVDGSVFFKQRSGDLPVPHPMDRRGIIMDIHRVSHAKEQQIYDFMKSRYHFSKMFDFIKFVISECLVCVQSTFDFTASKDVIPVMPRLAHDVLSEIQIDLIFLTESMRGFSIALVIIGTRSTFVQVIPIRNKESDTISNALLARWIFIFGIPDRIRSDQGDEFVSRLALVMCNQYGIIVKSSSAYNPAAQGLVERKNQEVKKGLTKLCHDCPGDWDLFVDQVAYGLNIMPSAWRKYSAFELVFNRRPKVVLTLDLLDEEALVDTELVQRDYESFYKDRFAVANDVALALNRSYQAGQNKMAQLYSPFAVGDFVWRREHDPKAITQLRYKGPFVVKEVAVNSCIIADENGQEYTVSWRELKRSRQTFPIVEQKEV